MKKFYFLTLSLCFASYNIYAMDDIPTEKSRSPVLHFFKPVADFFKFPSAAERKCKKLRHEGDKKIKKIAALEQAIPLCHKPEKKLAAIKAKAAQLEEIQQQLQSIDIHSLNPEELNKKNASVVRIEHTIQNNTPMNTLKLSKKSAADLSTSCRELPIKWQDEDLSSEDFRTFFDEKGSSQEDVQTVYGGDSTQSSELSSDMFSIFGQEDDDMKEISLTEEEPLVSPLIIPVVTTTAQKMETLTSLPPFALAKPLTAQPTFFMAHVKHRLIRVAALTGISYIKSLYHCYKKNPKLPKRLLCIQALENMRKNKFYKTGLLFTLFFPKMPWE